MKRLVSIDVLRASAILLMMQTHFVIVLSKLEPDSWILRAVSLHFLGVLAAPAFAFLLGLSLHIWLQRTEATGHCQAAIAKPVVRRGLFLFTCGFAYSTIIHSPKYVFDWEILNILGLSTLILYALRKVSTTKLMAFALVVAMISPLLRILSGYTSHWPEQWPEGFYQYEFTIHDVALGFLVNGFNPFFPWIVFPLIGFIVGRQLTVNENGEPVVGGRVLGMGLVFACLAGITVRLEDTGSALLSGYFCRPTLDPASTSLIMTMLALMCLSFWILNHYLDRPGTPLEKPIIQFFKRYSAFSLTAYLVHWATLIWSLHLLAALTGKEQDYYFGKLNIYLAFLLTVLFITVFYWLLGKWELKRKYSFEGLLRWISES